MERFLSSVLSLVMIMSIFTSVPITVNAASIDVLTFELNETRKSYLVTDCETSASGELVIPNTYNGLPVTELINYAISDCSNITSVKIPDNVKVIGSRAFENCTSLRKVFLSDNITSIGYKAFNNTEYYNYSSNWSNSVLYIGKYLIEARDGLSGNYKVKDGTTIISDSAFDNCEELTEVTLPDTVTHIGDNAFVCCFNLSYVSLGSSVFSIGECAFSNCNLLDVEFPDGLENIGSKAFENCEKLTSITIPDGVVSIGSAAFMNCEDINNIKIPNTLINVGRSVFYNTAYYNDISNWDNDVLYINNHLIDAKKEISGKYTVKEGTNCIAAAFSDCVYLNGITVPEGVTSISDGAFSYCASLDSVTIPDTVVNMGDEVFYQCTNITSVKLSKNLTGIGESVFDGCESLKEILIPNGVANICYRAFAGCKNISSIVIPSSIENLYGQVFNGCTSLTSIIIPKNVKRIGFGAFLNCTGLSEIILEDGITIIERGAFKGCENLFSVNIPKSVSEIGDEAFGYYGGGYLWSPLHKVENFTISGYSASAAETYAKENDFSFVENKECEHKNTKWITDKKATVNSAGKKHKECTECGETLETATIKQLKCSKPKVSKITNTATGVKITWSKVSGADSYEVYRKVKGGSYSKVATTSKTYFTDKKAKSGKQYYYVVKALNEAGKSSNSNALSIKYLADPTLKTPTSTKSGITLKWSKVTGAQGYVVYRKTGNGSYKKLATVKGVTKISYLDKSAKKNNKYTYKVKAYYGKTYSAYSNTKTVKDKY